MTTLRFPYVQVDPSLGVASALPYIPVTLINGQQEIVTSALVDSGAALNVLTYHIGEAAFVDTRHLGHTL